MSYWLIGIFVLGLLGIGVLHRITQQKSISTSTTAPETSLKHLGIIMDGNRRWARKNSLSLPATYRRGIDTLYTVIDYCVTRKIPVLSVYAFSFRKLAT